MYLVYLPDVGRSSEPLVQKHVGRGSSCVADDQEEDQATDPRRRRAYNGIAGTEHLEVGDDRRVGQRPVELAPRVPRFDIGASSRGRASPPSRLRHTSKYRYFD